MSNPMHPQPPHFHSFPTRPPKFSLSPSLAAYNPLRMATPAIPDKHRTVNPSLHVPPVHLINITCHGSGHVDLVAGNTVDSHANQLPMRGVDSVALVVVSDHKGADYAGYWYFDIDGVPSIAIYHSAAPITHPAQTNLAVHTPPVTPAPATSCATSSRLFPTQYPT